MKIKILALITAMLMFTMVFAGCGEEENTATPDEAVSDTATADEAVTSVSASTAPSTSATQPTGAQTQKTTTAPGTTQPTTQKPVQDNIPEDTIGSGNINPNLYGIIDLVVQEMNELAIRTISLDYSKLSIKVGESAQLKISYNPENAVPKTCKVSSGNRYVLQRRDGVLQRHRYQVRGGKACGNYRRHGSSSRKGLHPIECRQMARGC